MNAGEIKTLFEWNPCLSSLKPLLQLELLSKNLQNIESIEGKSRAKISLAFYLAGIFKLSLQIICPDKVIYHIKKGELKYAIEPFLEEKIPYEFDPEENCFYRGLNYLLMTPLYGKIHMSPQTIERKFFFQLAYDNKDRIIQFTHPNLRIPLNVQLEYDSKNNVKKTRILSEWRFDGTYPFEINYKRSK